MPYGNRKRIFQYNMTEEFYEFKDTSLLKIGDRLIKYWKIVSEIF